MFQKFVFPCFLSLVLLLSACAPLQPGYETPVVSITSFEAIPSDSIMPKFKIGLHIVNPNRTPLVLKGVSYTIALEGHKIMTGVSNELPQIEPYGKADITLHASVDLFSSIGFFTDLINQQGKQNLSYSFTAKLDAGAFHPLIKIKKDGILSLTEPADSK